MSLSGQAVFSQLDLHLLRMMPYIFSMSWQNLADVSCKRYVVVEIFSKVRTGRTNQLLGVARNGCVASRVVQIVQTSISVSNVGLPRIKVRCMR